MMKSRSVKRCEKKCENARGLGRDRAVEPVRIFLMACSGITSWAQRDTTLQKDIILTD